MVDIPASELNVKSLWMWWIVWAGMLGILFVSGFICQQWADQVRQAVSFNFPSDLIRNILYGIAIFILILTRFIRKRMLAGQPDGLRPKLLESPSLSNQPELLVKYMKAVLVSMALSEFIGIIGLVSIFLGDGLQVFYTFLAISALAMFFYRPRREKIEALGFATQKK